MALSFVRQAGTATGLHSGRVYATGRPDADTVATRIYKTITHLE